jgi:hypothetical protein
LKITGQLATALSDLRHRHVQPILNNDTLFLWDLSNASQMDYLKTDTTNYLLFILKYFLKQNMQKILLADMFPQLKLQEVLFKKKILPIVLELSSQPYPSVKVLPDTIKLVEGNEFLLSVADVQNNFFTYLWQKNNEPITIDTSALHITHVQEVDSGVYRCIVYNQCHSISSNSSIVIIGKQTSIDTASNTNTTTGIADQKVAKQYTAYPNPNSGIIFFNVGYSNATSYKLTDLTGTMIKEGQIPSGGSINIQEVPNGLYLFKLWM